MRLRELFREAAIAALSARVSSLLVLAVVAATCIAALLTVGQQAAAEQRLAKEFARPASRMLTLTDDNDSGRISAAAVASLGSLNHAETVVASDTPRDAVNALLGDGAPKVSIVTIAGDTTRALRLTEGRMPQPGTREVLVSASVASRLGLVVPSGALETADWQEWDIVGSFAAQPPFDELEGYAVHLDTQPVAIYRKVQIVADSVSAVPGAQQASLAILAPQPGDLAVQSAVAAAATSSSATAQLTAFGRSLMLLILGAGAFFVAVVVLADVLIHQRDLGRRRTLGITRFDLVALVTLRTALPAALGALLATGGGLATAWAKSMPLPAAFAFSVAVLATVTACVAAIAPAVLAAWRDPVAVMRVA